MGEDGRGEAQEGCEDCQELHSSCREALLTARRIGGQLVALVGSGYLCPDSLSSLARNTDTVISIWNSIVLPMAACRYVHSVSPCQTHIRLYAISKEIKIHVQPVSCTVCHP